MAQGWCLDNLSFYLKATLKGQFWDSLTKHRFQKAVYESKGGSLSLGGLSIMSRMTKSIIIKSLFIFLILFVCAPVMKSLAPLYYQTIQASTYTDQECWIQVGDQSDIRFFYAYAKSSPSSVQMLVTTMPH